MCLYLVDVEVKGGGLSNEDLKGKVSVASKGDGEVGAFSRRFFLLEASI